MNQKTIKFIIFLKKTLLFTNSLKESNSYHPEKNLTKYILCQPVCVAMSFYYVSDGW